MVEPKSDLIDPKAILDWCFIIGALNLSVLGFLYSSYVTFVLATPNPPRIVRFLKEFCVVMAGVLVILAVLAAYTTMAAGFGFATWVMVGCLSIVAIYSIRLVLLMN